MLCSVKVAFLLVFYTGILRKSLIESVWWNGEKENNNKINENFLRILNRFFPMDDLNLNRQEPSNFISYDARKDGELRDEYYGSHKSIDNMLFLMPSSKLSYGIKLPKNNYLNNSAKNKIIKSKSDSEQEGLMTEEDSQDENLKNNFLYEDSGFKNDYKKKYPTEGINDLENNNGIESNFRDETVEKLGSNKARDNLNNLNSNDDFFLVDDSKNKVFQTTKHLKNSNFLFRSPNFLKSNPLGDTRRTYDRRSENSMKQFDLIILHPCTSISAARLSEDRMKMLGAIKFTYTKSEDNFRKKLLSKFHLHRNLLKTVLEKMVSVPIIQ